jgi:hypothetical protein
VAAGSTGAGHVDDGVNRAISQTADERARRSDRACGTRHKFPRYWVVFIHAREQWG